MKLLLALMLLITQWGGQTNEGRLEGTWSAAAEFTGEGDMPRTSLANTTLRQVIKVSRGGKKMSLRLSNEFSAQPLYIKTVYVADAKDSCDIITKTAKTLKFNGKKSVVIPAGGTVDSDLLPYSLQPLQRLSITICYAEKVPENMTSHRGSRTTSYIMRGCQGPKKAFQPIEKVDHWYNICQLNLLNATNEPAEIVAVLGNSITDGRGSTTNAQNRWPDQMAEALQGQVGVLNLGIGGNCVIRGGISEPALQRFDRDILGQNGLTKLIIFQGTNDIGTSADTDADQVADALIVAYQQLIRKAQEKGLTTYVATITPFKGNGWYTPAHEKARQKVNQWIRSNCPTGRLIDFDQLVRDPQDIEKLQAIYSDDWLHLNPKGYEVMGKYAANILKKQ